MIKHSHGMRGLVVIVPYQDGGLHLAVVDDSNDHVLSIWDWQKGEKGVKIAENKVSSI